MERDIGDARLFGEQFQLICGVPDGKGGGESLYTVEEAMRLAQDMNLKPPPKTEVKPETGTKSSGTTWKRKTSGREGKVHLVPSLKRSERNG